MKTRIVNVRALPRQGGFDSFCRGGHRWPSTGKTVTVTEELYRVLKSERMLAIDLDPERHPETDEIMNLEDGVVEHVDNFCGDREWNAGRALRAENELMEKQLENLEARRKNAALKRELARAQADAAADEAEAERFEAELKAREAAKLDAKPVDGDPKGDGKPEKDPKKPK